MAVTADHVHNGVIKIDKKHEKQHVLSEASQAICILIYTLPAYMLLGKDVESNE